MSHRRCCKPAPSGPAIGACSYIEMRASHEDPKTFDPGRRIDVWYSAWWFQSGTEPGFPGIRSDFIGSAFLQEIVNGQKKFRWDSSFGLAAWHRPDGAPFTWLHGQHADLPESSLYVSVTQPLRGVTVGSESQSTAGIAGLPPASFDGHALVLNGFTPALFGEASGFIDYIDEFGSVGQFEQGPDRFALHARWSLKDDPNGSPASGVIIGPQDGPFPMPPPPGCALPPWAGSAFPPPA